MGLDEKARIIWIQSFAWTTGDKVELIKTENEYIVYVTIAYKTNLTFDFKEEGDAALKFAEYKAWFFDKHLVKGK
jgi:hypothetical protein